VLYTYYLTSQKSQILLQREKEPKIKMYI
jgi:hypothetical protein